MSLFRYALGPTFDSLHPVLQRHYDPPQGSVVLKGEMETWNRVPFLRVALPFAPRNAAAVKVVVRNDARRDAQGMPTYEWQREFHYPQGVLRSSTLTRLSPVHAHEHVMDVFPPPTATGIELRLSILEDGFALMQRSTSNQYLLIGLRRLRLPLPLRVSVCALERALSEDEVESDVVIGHPWLGRLFGYRGKLKLIR